MKCWQVITSAALLGILALSSGSVAAAPVAAFADVHGGYDELRALLASEQIIDGAEHWIAGDLQLISLGDLLDRGDAGRQVVELLMRLQREAGAAGGRLAVVLGNHEIMNLTGELDYVSHGDFAQFAPDETTDMRAAAFARMMTAGRYANMDPGAARAAFDDTFPAGYFARMAAFAPDGVYGRWLLQQHVVLKTADTLFVHGGLPPVLATEAADSLSQRLLTETRAYATAWQALIASGAIDPDTAFADRATLATARMQAPVEQAQIDTLRALQDSAAFGTDGPLWYRGQALCHPAYEQDVLDAALHRQKVQRVVVGHTVTPTRRVTARFDGRVILADTGMLAPVYHGRASMVHVDGAAVTVSYAGAPARVAPLDDPVMVGYRPGAMDDVELGQNLTRAPIMTSTQLPDGRQRVELALPSSVRIYAAAAALDASRPWRGSGELAAYTLDRLLDLRLVPATVRRDVDDRDSAVQYLPTRTVTHRQRQAAGDRSQGWCPLQAQYDLMMIFDALIGMPARDPDWISYTSTDPMLILTANGAGFETSSRLPDHLRSAEVTLPRTLATKLGSLDEPALTSALPMLTARQIRALLKRRDLLMKRWSVATPVVAHDE